MRVGVTGASGLLGAGLVESLAARDDVQVIALTRTLSVADGPQRRDVDWREGDLSSPRDAARFVEDLDCIVHLAHKGSPLTSGRDLPDDARSDLVPMLTLLQAIRDRGRPCHVVYASSGGALYGRSEPGLRATEQSPVAISNSYAIQKLAGENYLRLAVSEGWLTVSRPADRKCVRGGPLPRSTPGFPRRRGLTSCSRRAAAPDWRHSKCTRLCPLQRCLFGFRAGARAADRFRLFNIGTGHGTSIDELVDLLQEVSGVRATIERAPTDEDRGTASPLGRPRFLQGKGAARLGGRLSRYGTGSTPLASSDTECQRSHSRLQRGGDASTVAGLDSRQEIPTWNCLWWTMHHRTNPANHRGICNARCSSHRRHNERNLGLAATLNHGLELARHELVARMDQDDESLPVDFRQLAS